ncbi:hypothetical protein E2320_018399 [Naja naja]|nr:hypothetical protein E2320_018399 [Naja naja]
MHVHLAPYDLKNFASSSFIFRIDFSMFEGLQPLHCTNCHFDTVFTVPSKHRWTEENNTVYASAHIYTVEWIFKKNILQKQGQSSCCHHPENKRKFVKSMVSSLR